MRRAIRLAVLGVGLLAIHGCTPLPAARLADLPRASADTCVILMHGLARSTRSMGRIQKALERVGYRVVNLGYPSREHDIDTLTTLAVPPALAACRDRPDTRIHIVTHSLGGILLRRHLEDEPIDDLVRVVMLAPPNRGSEVVDTFGSLPGFDMMNGPAGAELGTGTDDMPASLGPIRVDTAVIAGTRTINPILSQALPNPDDGKVSVARTELDGMCAHLTLPVSHPFILRDPDAIIETLTYLATGRFTATDARYLDCPARA